MVEAIVEHDYNAKQADELTIKKGDVIKDVVKKQDGWCEGVLDGKKGLFPDNFVVLLQANMRTNATKSRKCRVVYSYKQEHEDELNLNVGDVIEVVGEEEEGWWRGKLNGKVGVFPSNFVEEIAISITLGKSAGSKEVLNKDDDQPMINFNTNKEQEQPSQETKQSKILCEVKYAYQAQNSDELTLKEGDLVTLISKDGQDVGWWRGELNGKVGVFPDNFVAIIETKQDLFDDRSEKRSIIQTNHSIKTQHVAQRRSQEVKGIKSEAIVSIQSQSVTSNSNSISTGIAVPPAVPNKKPTVPFKKSPSGSGGGLFSSISGITKKIADTIDGSTSSKSIKLNSDLEGKDKDASGSESYHAFDQVERNSILPDVRANRVKAPGRRPPSVAFKEGEGGLINGNSDYGSLEDNIEQENNAEIKPKSIDVQKPPWLAEMKMNMKRTSTSPCPPGSENKSNNNKLEMTSTGSIDELKSPELSPIDMSKSMPSMMFTQKKAEVRLPKTPPNELERGDKAGKDDKEKVVMRTKPIVNIRPQSIDAPTSRPIAKTSPTIHKSPSPAPSPIAMAKPPIADRSSMEMISSRHYNELSERLTYLEGEMMRQREEYRAAVDDLQGKLQVETDMRMLLQVELEKLQNRV